MKKVTYILTILIIVLFSCTDIVNNEKNEYTIHKFGESIYPLKVGNKWIYKHTVYINDTLIHSTELNTEVVDSVSIVVNDKTVESFKIVEEQSSYATKEKFNLYSLMNYEESILYRYGFSVNEEEYYYFRKDPYLIYPVEVGTQWHEDHGDYWNVFTCIKKDTLINLENKQFNCIVIRTGGGWSYIDSYYSFGYGLIQEILDVDYKYGDHRVEKKVLIGTIN